MTSKQYKTAQGKIVDMGAIMLQNENTRAVGNMNVNARGDRINSGNRVIDKKSQQIKRQYKKQTVNNGSLPATTSNAALRRSQAEAELAMEVNDIEVAIPEDTIVVTDAPSELQGGLAAAIAKAKTVQQTKLPTPKEAAKAAGVRKI